MFLLASTSPYRRTLLARLGLPFEVIDSQVDEAHMQGEEPVQRARRLAIAKARAVALRYPQALVVGADQVAALGPRILDKPGNAARCAEQLAALSGQTALFHTACALGDRVHVDTTSVLFRVLGDAEIERYVAAERPFDCAGGFKAEGLGISLFERIESQDPTALIGLPLIWLAGALRDAGVRVP